MGHSDINTRGTDGAWRIATMRRTAPHTLSAIYRTLQGEIMEEGMELKRGDRVCFREWRDMADEFGCNENGTIKCKYGFMDDMIPLCGTYATVESVDYDGRVRLMYFSNTAFDTAAYAFSADMLVKATEGERKVSALEGYSALVNLMAGALAKSKEAEGIVATQCGAGKVEGDGDARLDCHGLDCTYCALRGKDGCLKHIPDLTPSDIRRLEAYLKGDAIDWSKVARDTPILVRDTDDDEWLRRYFAEYNPDRGGVLAYHLGATSWSQADDDPLIAWKQARVDRAEDRRTGGDAYVQMEGGVE